MKTNPKTYLALGDSYSIGEGVALNESFPHQLAKKLDLATPQIIATTGWRTDELLCAIYKEDLLPKYDLVTLLIGVNNQYQGRSLSVYKNEFLSLLLKAKELGEQVRVLSIPDYGFTPFGKKNPTITLELEAFNRVNRELSKSLDVPYVDITELSRLAWEDASLLAEDELHPSGKQYGFWVEEILREYK